MAYFALLWKARTIEKYRSNYEKEKINSMLAANAELPRHNISQKWKLYRYNSQKKIGRTFRKWCPEGSRVSNFFVYLTTDQTFANFLVKSAIGFVGGIVLTYFWFMFFVFQLSISLIHATIMSSFIGVLLTLGLAFSYRIRCLVFLLIPQFFSRVGRYTLTCYALVLILTGPATNTLKNSEVLSESLACGQEQVRLNVNKISEAIDKPLQLLKETINSTMKRIKSLAAKVKEVMVNTHRVVMSIAHVLQSSLAWLTSVEAICNSELGTPYEHCARVLSQGNHDYKNHSLKKRNIEYLIQAVCINVKPDSMCIVGDFARSSIVATVKKKLENYSDRIKSLLSLTLHAKRSHACYSNASRSASQAAAGIVTEIRHRADPLLTWLSWSSYLTSLFLMLIIFSNASRSASQAAAGIVTEIRHRADPLLTWLSWSSYLTSLFLMLIIFSNASRSASQAAAGIVTEIRHRADPLLTWLSWSSYLTSLFLMLIIFRAKYYQQMFETRSRFDNRYVTKEFRDLDFRRLRQGRETVLPLNTRERAKYVSTSSFRLLASERVHLTRSIVFMVITTFKLSIHMVADYSLYWVLRNMRFHGRFQALTQRDPTASISVSGSGPLAGLLRGLLEALGIPLALPSHSPITCLPNPLPPDFQRYAQIGVLILLLWVFALFEPYGLRLRHVIMSHYQPERARARAEWLYNHIIRTRGCFLKYARRKLHREYKYSTEQRHTFRNWMNDVIPCQWLRCLLGVGPEEPRCMLCNVRHIDNDPNTYLKRCESPCCPGVYCTRCFMDIGQLCTICLSPKDYGDLSDMSLENSSEESDDDNFDDDNKDLNKPLLKPKFSGLESNEGASTSQKKFAKKGFQVFSRTRNKNSQESIPLLNRYSFKRKNDCVLTQPLKRHPKIEQHDDDDKAGKNYCVLTQPLKRHPKIEQHDDDDKAGKIDCVLTQQLKRHPKIEQHDDDDKAGKNDCVLTQPLKRCPEVEQRDNDERAICSIFQSKEPKIPVIVRDNQKLLKFVEVPKEKLTAIRNTMTLLTTKMEDDKFNKEWNTHDSKTFEYLVMEFFQPVDIFKKALFVRHTKYDSRLSLNNDEKIDSLKEVMNFLCSYQMNDVTSNNANDKTNTTLHPNTSSDTAKTPSNNNVYGNAEKFTKDGRISDRNMKNILFFFHFKQTVPGDLFIRLNRRKVFLNPVKYDTKKLNLKALNRMYGNIAGTTKLLNSKRSKQIQGPSFHDLPKCRSYEINKETFAKNLRIKLKKISLQKKNVTRRTNYLALEKKLAEQMQKCPSLNGGAPIYSNSNVLTECSSDINPSDLKNLPHRVEETHEIKIIESSDKNIPTTNDNNVISDRKLLKIGGYCSCIWKRTKNTLKSRKLENSSKNKEPCANVKANHKRRKKMRLSGKDTRIKVKLNAKKVKDEARNYRMSLFLKEQDWLRNQINGVMSNKDKNSEKIKVEIKMTKLEYRRKLKEQNVLKKAAKKQLTRQLKLKSKAEQKLKKQSMKKKHDHTRSLNTEGISFKNTTKANTNKGKSSMETSACFARKLIRNVTREIASRNKLRKVVSRRHLPSYLNFYGFTCPALNEHASSCSLDLDEIFQPPWDADFGETRVFYQDNSNRLCEDFFWPYCRKADDSTQTCDEKKNDKENSNKNTTIPESEEWVKEILNPKAISMRAVASEVLLGIKKSVEKIRKFQSPQKRCAEKEVTAAPVMRTCSCQNVSTNKKSKQSQAQVALSHCGTQYEYEPIMNVLFTKNLSKPIEKEQTCAFCTCAVQSMFPKKEDVVKVDVGTMHFNALKKMQHASAQWHQQITPFQGFSGEEPNFTDLSEINSISISDNTKTDTTICSWLKYNIAYEHITPKAKVVRTTNQSTSTNRMKRSNVSTTTVDWWSPIVERKKNRKPKEVSKKDDGDRQSIGVETDGKCVSFRSYAQIIPAEFLDILSPSRYLLESQKYYNEMFTPHIKQKKKDQCYFNTENPYPNIGIHRPRKANKTKRLEESYLPKKKTQTSTMNMDPLSWRPARENISSLNVKNKQRRNAKLQSGLKSRNNDETISKTPGILIKEAV